MFRNSLHNRSGTLTALAAAGLLGAGLLTGATANGAGTNAATSMYITIQPDGTLGVDATGYVYTLSWVATDTNTIGDGATYANGSTANPYGNGGSALDNVNNFAGGDYVNGNGQKVLYRWQAVASSGSHIKYENTLPNTSTLVQWTDPANYTIGAINPTTTTPKFDNLGNFTPGAGANLAYGSGVQGVTGVFSTNPDGTGAATGQGVGIYTDDDGFLGNVDSIGPLLSGYDDVLDPTMSNPLPSTGYMRVYVPFPTAGYTSDPFTERYFPGLYTGNAAVELTVTTSPTYVPEIALSGDFDSDHAIGNSDIGVVFGNFGMTGAWYSDGDTDADGTVGNSDIGVVFGGFGTSNAGNLTDSGTLADLIYDPVTGNVTLDASESSGSVITNYVLRNAAGTFIPANFTAVLPGAFDTQTGLEVSESDGSGVGVSGLLDLGNIFPTGMTLTQLESYLTKATYVGQLGSGVQTLDLVVAAVPEPATLGLMTIGGLMLIRRRRMAA